jgi:hypothetical protein
LADCNAFIEREIVVRDSRAEVCGKAHRTRALQWPISPETDQVANSRNGPDNLFFLHADFRFAVGRPVSIDFQIDLKPIHAVDLLTALSNPSQAAKSAAALP